MSSPQDATPVLAVRDAHKSFGAVRALSGVSFELHQGEILALLGDNGAGKSTLIKAISGVHRLDSGSIFVGGREVEMKSPHDARDLGIETVYQELAIFDNLTPRENFFIGREVGWPTWLKGSLGVLNNREMSRKWRKDVDALQVKIPSGDRQMGLMSGGQRQAVVVARAVAFATRVVILDEPTAALGVRESQEVLRLISDLPRHGVSVVLISHNLEHVTKVADRAVIVRQGVKVGEAEATAENHERLVAMIVGARVAQNAESA